MAMGISRMAPRAGAFGSPSNPGAGMAVQDIQNEAMSAIQLTKLLRAYRAVKRHSALQVELFYSRSDSRIDFVEYRGPTYKLTDVSVNYFQLGGVRHIKKMDNIVVYGLGTLGATLFSPSGDPYDETPERYTYQDYWLFSLTLGGGAKVFLSDRIGLRFEGRIMMPITWAGGGFMIGTGGSGFYFGGGSAILQAGLMGGVIIALGK